MAFSGIHFQGHTCHSELTLPHCPRPPELHQTTLRSQSSSPLLSECQLSTLPRRLFCLGLNATFSLKTTLSFLRTPVSPVLFTLRKASTVTRWLLGSRALEMRTIHYSYPKHRRQLLNIWESINELMNTNEVPCARTSAKAVQILVTYKWSVTVKWSWIPPYVPWWAIDYAFLTEQDCIAPGEFPSTRKYLIAITIHLNSRTTTSRSTSSKPQSFWP